MPRLLTEAPGRNEASTQDGAQRLTLYPWRRTSLNNPDTLDISVPETETETPGALSWASGVSTSIGKVRLTAERQAHGRAGLG